MEDVKPKPNWNRKDAITVRGIIERMNLCGCGTDAHYEIVLELLERGADHDKRGSFYAFNLDHNSKDVRDSWVEFGAKVLDSWDLIEHGTGIGWAWLTDDGKLMLRFLQDFGVENWHMDSPTGHPLWSIEYSWNETPKPDDSFSEWEASQLKP